MKGLQSLDSIKKSNLKPKGSKKGSSVSTEKILEFLIPRLQAYELPKNIER